MLMGTFPIFVTFILHHGIQEERLIVMINMKDSLFAQDPFDYVINLDLFWQKSYLERLNTKKKIICNYYLSNCFWVPSIDRGKHILNWSANRNSCDKLITRQKLANMMPLTLAGSSKKKVFLQKLELILQHKLLKGEKNPEFLNFYLFQ